MSMHTIRLGDLPGTTRVTIQPTLLRTYTMNGNIYEYRPTPIYKPIKRRKGVDTE